MSTLIFGDRPAGYWQFLDRSADVLRLAANIGEHKPDEHARHMLSVVVDEMLVFADALYEAGWEDLLARVQVVFEVAGQPLDALRERRNLPLGQFSDLAGQADDLPRIPGEGLTRPAAVAEGHSAALIHDESSVLLGSESPVEASVGESPIEAPWNHDSGSLASAIDRVSADCDRFIVDCDRRLDNVQARPGWKVKPSRVTSSPVSAGHNFGVSGSISVTQARRMVGHYLLRHVVEDGDIAQSARAGLKSDDLQDRVIQRHHVSALEGLQQAIADGQVRLESWGVELKVGPLVRDRDRDDLHGDSSVLGEAGTSHEMSVGASGRRGVDSGLGVQGGDLR